VRSRRGCTWRLAAIRRVLAADIAAFHLERRLGIGRAFLGNANLDQRAVRIAEPQAVGLKTLRRVEPVDPHALQPLAEPRHVVLERAERDEVQLLARALGDGAPAMRVAVGEGRAAASSEVETERAVELSAWHVGDQQVELVSECTLAADGAPAGPSADLVMGKCPGLASLRRKICPCQLSAMARRQSQATTSRRSG
jgi:hypothetical protein